MSGFDPTFKYIVNKEINSAGYWIFALFIFSYYSLIFYQELSPPDPHEVLEEGARTMADQARELNN